MVFKNFTPWVAMKGQYQVRILSDHCDAPSFSSDLPLIGIADKLNRLDAVRRRLASWCRLAAGSPCSMKGVSVYCETHGRQA
jgi:hypothetical protein